MLTFQVSGVTPHDSTVPVANMLDKVVAEMRKLLRMNSDSRKPVVIELVSDIGRVKCTVADPAALVDSLEPAPHQNGGREWMVGYYVPTANFLNMQEHTAVMDARTQALVATCGPSGDPASMRDACLFAVSPKLHDLCQQVLTMTLRGESVETLVPDLQAALAQVPSPKQEEGVSSKNIQFE